MENNKLTEFIFESMDIVQLPMSMTRWK